MSEHTKARTGLWTLTDDPELWPGLQFFDTREEAVANADGYYSHVGQVTTMTDDEVASAFIRSIGEADECLVLQDEWAWANDSLLNPPSEDARAELHAFVVDWVRRHKVNGERWYAIAEEVRDE